jgi:D-alanine-D-alanine ligase
MDLEIYKDMDNLRRYAKNVVLYNTKDGFILQNKKGFKRIVDQIDLVLPIVHGTNVEDGTLQGYLELVGIPYAESGLYASVVGQDKVYMKQIFESEKLPVVDYIWFYDSEYIENTDDIKKKVNKLGYPVIVKPASLGSSIGISKVKNEEELIEAIETAIKYDPKVIIESVVEIILISCSTDSPPNITPNLNFILITPYLNISGKSFSNNTYVSFSFNLFTNGNASITSSNI